MTSKDVKKLLETNPNADEDHLNAVLSIVRTLRKVGVVPTGYRIEPAFGRGLSRDINAMKNRKLTEAKVEGGE